MEMDQSFLEVDFKDFGYGPTEHCLLSNILMNTHSPNPNMNEVLEYNMDMASKV